MHEFFVVSSDETRIRVMHGPTGHEFEFTVQRLNAPGGGRVLSSVGRTWPNYEISSNPDNVFKGARGFAQAAMLTEGRIDYSTMK